MQDYKIDFSSIPWQSPLPKARFKAHEHGGCRLRILEFERGFVEPDWCQNGHIGYVIEGRLEVDFDGSIETFEAGDAVTIPEGSDHKHKARPLTDVVRLFLIEDI